MTDIAALVAISRIIPVITIRSTIQNSLAIGFENSGSRAKVLHDKMTSRNIE